MTDGTDGHAPAPVSRRRKKSLREMLALLLDSSGPQREYLINIILAQSSGEPGREPSLRENRARCANIQEQLVGLLRAEADAGPGQLLPFFKHLDNFPLDPEHELPAALSQIFPLGPGETEKKLFHRLELFWLLTLMGDLDSARPLRKELEPQVSLQQPRLYIIWLLSLARILQKRGKRLSFSSLWLNLICEYHSLDGPATALYLILRWVRMLSWGRDTALRKQVLQKFGARLRQRNDLLSATLLYELFNQEHRHANPGEKMLYTRLLLHHPSSLLSVQQLQYLHFFAGNYLSAVKASIPQSIREFQHSNYYLHKSWSYLQNLSFFLRANLHDEQYARAMTYLQQRVVELGSQISLQNNAYVETLHENYSTIKTLLRQVEELSITDNLTGLKNRRYLANNLYHAFQLAARHKVPVCLAILDIDFFKSVNDRLGHPAGDQVLKSLARLLLSSFRKSDAVIRYGGEEFLLVLFDVSQERMEALMNELRHKVASHRFSWQGNPIRISVSIGWATTNQACLSQSDLDEQIARIDAALYTAKNTGRDQVVRAPDRFPA
ncbi:MAG: GGDEF domain-containing protein [Candidatus Cloacimonetes bacterium]|jgi:diguanylate cyclase (GGDEF)-like protein|nr:GGDEF domain-containing protein [Candidatus Cloacimonadota bacterium]